MNKTTLVIATAALIAFSAPALARPIHQASRADRGEIFRLNPRAYSSFRGSYNSFAPQGGVDTPPSYGSLAYKEFHHLDTGIHD
jgi:hypothetical protein